MRLGEALRISAEPHGERRRLVHLVCGFEPLHLIAFFKAHLRLRFPEDAINVATGLYDDLEGNIQRAVHRNAEGALVAVEWADIDQRLGFRNSSGWGTQTLEDILAQAAEKCNRLENHLAALAEVMPVTVVAPTLPLPPLTHLPPARTSGFELHLNRILITFLDRLSERRGLALLNSSALSMVSSPSSRHDLKMELASGFPYSLAHADAVAELAVSCLFPGAPKKGLITDLDQTLWKGILGDAGVEGISWSLETKSQAHALYQQLLASLAESGVLLAVASKNDAQMVSRALERSDILLPASQLFPIEATWGAKSDAVGRILRAWNVGADSVVFVDDSPMELAEVAEKHPGIECIQFPSGDPGAILALLHQLRVRFGKEAVGEEDRLRTQSLRAALELKDERAHESSEDFLARLNAQLTLDSVGPDDRRAFELVNKTNQFNLNGARYTDAEWKARAHRPGSFLLTISYVDRFGPLGRIGVVGGQMEGGRFTVDVWVLSCRAFSRQIELQTLRQLFAKTHAHSIYFEFRATERNGPLQTFLSSFFSNESLRSSEIKLRRETFEEFCPTLFHEVIDRWTLLDRN